MLVHVENKKSSLFRGFCLDQSKDGVTEIAVDAKMLESLGAIKDGGWLQLLSSHPQ
jgi:hypothetical protein